MRTLKDIDILSAMFVPTNEGIRMIIKDNILRDKTLTRENAYDWIRVFFGLDEEEDDR